MSKSIVYPFISIHFECIGMLFVWQILGWEILTSPTGTDCAYKSPSSDYAGLQMPTPKFYSQTKFYLPQSFGLKRRLIYKQSIVNMKHISYLHYKLLKLNLVWHADSSFRLLVLGWYIDIDLNLLSDNAVRLRPETRATIPLTLPVISNWMIYEIDYLLNSNNFSSLDFLFRERERLKKRLFFDIFVLASSRTTVFRYLQVCRVIRDPGSGCRTLCERQFKQKNFFPNICLISLIGV